MIAALCPGARPLAFGHFGDGNVYYNISQPVGQDRAGFLARWEEVTCAVDALVLQFGGSFPPSTALGR